MWCDGRALPWLLLAVLVAVPAVDLSTTIDPGFHKSVTLQRPTLRGWRLGVAASPPALWRPFDLGVLPVHEIGARVLLLSEEPFVPPRA